MSRELIVAPEAADDLRDAFRWYEAQRDGLGSEFLAEIAIVFSIIEEAPEQFRIVRGGTRRVLVERFPYCVFYVATPDRITVTSVFHARRDPKHWHLRADV